ncbi:MAG TPA: glycosyltransferase family 4 protein [Planctomycetaceae bacterium]|nr:glycosyltransferase family 4 protein [Planctomycetaceae bacterium]
MKILQLTLSFHPGGRREMISNLMRRLPAFGVSCRLACLDEIGCETTELDDLTGGEVELLGRSRTLDFGAVRKLKQICQQHEIDVIHTHDAASQLIAALLRALYRRQSPPTIMTFHRSLGFESTRLQDRIRNRLACRNTQGVVTVSQERQAHYIRENGVNPNKVICIPNGIDVERFVPDETSRSAIRADLGITGNETVCGAIGHFGREKGLDLVIQAFAKLVRAEPARRIRLLIVGQGTAEQTDQLKQLAAELPPERVLFLGFRKDIEACFRAFDLFVHAPHSEAFGLVVAEAMAVGLPVVATRAGGIPEIVLDGETGRLVPVGDVSALAHALDETINQPDLRERWGEAGRERSREEFSLTIPAERYAKVYRAILDGNPLPKFEAKAESGKRKAEHLEREQIKV